ncbi:phosphatidylinositol transfer protein csr1 [Cladophialophora chaetospira]|uniref:Phosphatidylinositol transfer protein csr1 n=1 Tax=Cladophialophora chaetospira TaxID=386627 RepID=A0AA38WZD0_9EURO|nr:phosphatidylinositol transfer protein csr1 [Cladophialophora chaetospira]
MRRCSSQRLLPRSVFISPPVAQRGVFAYSQIHTPSQLRKKPQCPRPPPFPPARPARHLQPAKASISPYTALFVVACGGAILFEYFQPREAHDWTDHALKAEIVATLALENEDPFRLDMPAPPGHLGNLTPEQEAKLRDFWTVTLRVFGVEDPQHVAGTETPQTEDASSEVDVKDKEKTKKRFSVFKRHKDKESSSGTATPTKDPSHHKDSDDKYGQMKEFQEILATQSPESLRAAFWSMVKADHPDALLLRFLRARKWDVDKALVMLVSTMRWRSQEQHVDDDVVLRGEGGALEDSKSSDPAVKREGEDFLAQLRLGKSFLHGTDKEGRPLCFVRVRLHKGGDQTERSLERYTVYVIETARLALRPPVETACIVFDMSHFTMANMDYTPVKFMIKIFEANYPESLGAVLVHKSPWLFQGIWKIIRGWLDPVVAGKVHFTSNMEDLEKFIPRSQIITELEGDEKWEYKYIEPTPGENDAMKEEAPRKALEAERDTDVREYQKKTFDWISKGTGADADKVKEERHNLARQLNDNYWKLDKYVRARTLYDRTGMIGPDGKINFYPQTAKAPSVPTVATSADDVD